jgi:SOS-response transcriptional repressor LexA
VQSRSFAEMLDGTIKRYQNRAIETAMVIEELLALAREMREARARGEDLGLSEEELAFYDALETNDSAVSVMGDEVLRKLAQELADTVRRNVSIDWTLKERLLRKYGYPPDKQEKATKTMLQQAELFGSEWAEQLVLPFEAKERPPLVLIELGDLRVEEEAYETLLPVYSLKAAAGRFGEGQEVDPLGWMKVSGQGKLDENMFVAQVVGHSMEPRIDDGDYCVFRTDVVGSRQGKIVLVQHRDIEDPETGGSYTVKRYRSEKVADGEGGWKHVQIMLEPLNAEYAPIILMPKEEGEVQVVAEMVEVIRSG